MMIPPGNCTAPCIFHVPTPAWSQVTRSWCWRWRQCCAQGCTRAERCHNCTLWLSQRRNPDLRGLPTRPEKTCTVTEPHMLFFINFIEVALVNIGFKCTFLRYKSLSFKCHYSASSVSIHAHRLPVRVLLLPRPGLLFPQEQPLLPGDSHPPAQVSPSQRGLPSPPITMTSLALLST